MTAPTQTSRYVVATSYAAPAAALEVRERPLPEPGPGQVLIEVRAAGINPADVKMYSGAFGTDPAALPVPLGFEAAGVVVAVGAGAVGRLGPVAVGDEVVVPSMSGAYADHVVVDASGVLPRPAPLDWPAAAGLMAAGATAVHVLEAVDAHEDDVLLVHAASGGVGSLLVQLAALRGARVVATASPRNHDLLRDLGATPVAYGDGLADRVREAAPDGITAAADLVGTDEAIDTSLALLGSPERVASIAGFHRADTGIRLLGGGPGADPGTEIREAAYPELADLAAQGRLAVPVSATYALADVVAAHEAIASGSTRGKTAIVP